MPNCDPVTLMLGGMTVRKSTFLFQKHSLSHSLHPIILTRMEAVQKISWAVSFSNMLPLRSLHLWSILGYTDRYVLLKDWICLEHLLTRRNVKIICYVYFIYFCFKMKQVSSHTITACLQWPLTSLN